MTASFYLVLISVMALIISFFLLNRAVRRSSKDGVDWTDGDVSFAPKDEDLVLEVSARIFNPEDSDFVASETSRQITQQFRRERTTLALDWLRAVRGQVNQLMGAHFRASRLNDDLKPSDEIRLWFEFLLFQLTSGVLYLVIWVCGPPRAAKLVGYSLGLAAQLRKVTEEVLPAGRQVAAELMNRDQDPKNGHAMG